MSEEELAARVERLERERDALAQLYSELLILQQVFTAMNSAMDPEDILAMVLRGVHEALGFERVVLFDVDHGTVRRRLECGADGAIVHAPPEDVVVTPVVASLVQGRLDLALGSAEDEGAPVADADGPYCVVPLLARGEVRGLLYTDRPRQGTIDDAHVQALFDFAAQAAIVAENARLLAETRRLLESTEQIAATDPLTGLLNRRALGEQLDRELVNAVRYGNPLALMLIDLDDLKTINDTGGHEAGDAALRALADALRQAARKGDIVARYAGDEFVVVMTHADYTAAGVAAERIFGAVRAAGIRCSAGIAVHPYDGNDAQVLTRAADVAVYKAKRSGKDRYAFATIIVT